MNGRLPRYHRIADALRARIRGGEWAAGAPLPNQRRLAREFGVTLMTLRQALELGAVAVLVEEVPAGLDLRGRPAVVVRDSRRAMAPIAREFYGDPSGELTLIGVTGTNGKTSTTYLVESMLARAGRRVGLIGTVEIRYPGEHQPVRGPHVEFGPGRHARQPQHRPVGDVHLGEPRLAAAHPLHEAHGGASRDRMERAADVARHPRVVEAYLGAAS